MAKTPTALDHYRAALTAVRQQPQASPQRAQAAALVAQAIVANTHVMVTLARSLAQAVAILDAPKEIIRDASGKPVGIRPKV